MEHQSPLRHRIPDHPDLFYITNRAGYALYRTVGPGIDDTELVDQFPTRRELHKHIASLPTVTQLLAAAELKRAGVVTAAVAWHQAQEDWKTDRTEADDRLMHAVTEHLAAQRAMTDRRRDDK